MGLNGGSRAYRVNVLPAEQVSDSKAVMGCRFDRIEGGVRCVLRRIAVARSVVVLGKDARLGGHVEELVCRALLRRKGIDALRSYLAGFVDKLAPVIERRVWLLLEAQTDSLLVFLAGSLGGGRFHHLCRLHAPQDERLKVRVRPHQVIDAAVGSVDVVAFLMGTHTIGLRHHRRGGKDAQVLALRIQVQHRRIVGAALVAPLGIGDDGVVVVDELPAHAQAEPVFLRVADLGVSQLQIPANRVRRADRRVLEARTGVLHLRRDPQPAGRVQIHLEPESVQQVGVIGARFEA